MISDETNLKRTRVRVLMISRAALAREASIDTKTYGAIEDGIRPGRDITRESIKSAINRLLAKKQLKPLSTEELFSEG